jgi:thiol-disulfide isomerase/thioredoxin
MKKVLISILLIPLFFACTTAEKKGATLSGKVENLTAGFFILGGPGGAKDSIKIDAEGKFVHEIPALTKPSNYYLLVGKSDYMPFNIAPGMKLDISFNANAFKTSLKFAGAGSDINNYLVAKSVKAGNMNYDVFKLDPEPFKAKQDSILSAQQAFLAETVKENTNDPFWKTEEADILFGWAGNLSMFESYHGYFAQIEGYKVPESFYDFEKGIDINKPEYVNSSAFKGFVSNLVRKTAGKKIEALKKADSTQTINSEKIGLETALEIIKDQKVLDNHLYSDVSGQVEWKELGEVQESIDFFMANCKDTSLINKLTQTIAEWKRLGKGEPAFDFSGKDAQGNTIKLSDFKGKLVYVDVWATWCGPCKYEIPYLDTLETDYHGKNIVFISYSIDEDYDAWIKFVPEYHLQGVQIIGEKAWESKLCKDYKIMGVPTFMLFDTEGKIVSVKMTRPSDKKTRETFDSLL